MDVSVARPICDVTTSPVGPDRTLLTVRGELDIACPEPVLEAFRQASGSGRDVVVDLRSTSFIDSSGLLVLLSCLRRARDHARSCVVVCPPGPVRRVFELTGLSETFDLRGTLEPLQ